MLHWANHNLLLPPLPLPLQTLPLEPLPQSKTHGKVREIRGVLEDIRSQATTIETNLSVALKPSPKKRSISQLQRESKKLLAEVRRAVYIAGQGR